MVRRFSVLLLALSALGLALPSGAAAACTDGARVVRSPVKQRDVVRTAVVVCRDDRRRVVARGRLHVGRPDRNERRGLVYSDAALRRDRLAIGSLRYRGGLPVLAVELRSVATGRRLFRHARRVERSVAGPALVFSDVGHLAWRQAQSILVRRPDASVRVLPGAGAGRGLAIEDGRTLRWGDPEEWRYADLRPVPGPGCPTRRRFSPLLDRGGVQVTRATYGRDSFVLRACIAGRGPDPVLGTGFASDNASGFLAVVAASAPFVAVASSGYDRYTGCSGASLDVIDLRMGVAARRATNEGTAAHESCPLEVTGPRIDDASAITASGGLAWVRDGVLRGLDAAGAVVELDRGAIDGLRAEGETVHWRRDGVDRSAAL